VRSGRAETDAVGTLVLSIEGTQAGAPKSLDFSALTGGRQSEQRYGFRYFQDFDQALTVPSAFRPEQLQIEVRSNKKDVPPLSQSFLWSVETTP